MLTLLLVTFILFIILIICIYISGYRLEMKFKRNREIFERELSEEIKDSIKLDIPKNALGYSGYTVYVLDEQKAVDNAMPIFWKTIDKR